jgi:hypothetical protein
MFTDTLKRVLSDLGLADTEDNCRNVLASVVGLGCSVAELPAKLDEQKHWPHPHDPKRSDEDLIKILRDHIGDEPFGPGKTTPEEEAEWLDHVKACGGYEGTAWGGPESPDAF